MANEYNLIQFDEMPPERHKELSSRGGKVSGEKRRKKAALKKFFEMEMQRVAIAESFVEDIREFNRWKKQRDKVRAKRERTKEK